MDLTITKREALAICFHVQPRQLNTMDDIRKRRETWKSLGLADLASDVGEVIRNPRISISTDWLATDAFIGGELTDDQNSWLTAQCAQGPYVGSDAEHIASVHEKLKAK